jgi:hypothetical protein
MVLSNINLEAPLLMKSESNAGCRLQGIKIMLLLQEPGNKTISAR